jgi:hypothetical protein
LLTRITIEEHLPNSLLMWSKLHFVKQRSLANAGSPKYRQKKKLELSIVYVRTVRILHSIWVFTIYADLGITVVQNQGGIAIQLPERLVIARMAKDVLIKFSGLAGAPLLYSTSLALNLVNP